ncbi:MAG: hypothetical protein ACKOBM_05355, partial [Gammaproteobacteria bacterium]
QALPPAGVGPAELAPLAERLIALGHVLGAVLDGALAPTVACARLDDLAAPTGEYLLAPVAVLRAWLDRARPVA